MTFTVTPQPNNVPPRVRIDIDTDDPAKPFTTLQIMRDGKPIREQPYVGSAAAAVFDYEAPFGTSATYTVQATVATYSTLFSESWASLAGWTNASSAPSVSGSHLHGGDVTRSIAMPAEGRLTSQGLGYSWFSDESSIMANSVAGIHFMLRNEAAPQFQWGLSTRTVSGLGSPFTLTWDADSATLTTSMGTWTIAGVAPTSTQLSATTFGSTAFVEDFVIDFPSNAPFAASAATTLAVESVWLIHPSQPSLSCKIDDSADLSAPLWIEAASGDQKGSEPQSTVHRPIGRKKAVVITSGPRQADEWTLTIGAETIAAKNTVRAMVDDQTPLLLRSPASLVMDLPDDWYSVGKVTTDRPETPSVDELTYTTLPLIPVDEPMVRQGALWTWGSVMLRYATWQDVMDDNDTWLNVLTGESS